MLLVDDLAAGGTKNLRHTPRGLVTLIYSVHFSGNTVRGFSIVITIFILDTRKNWQTVRTQMKCCISFVFTVYLNAK